MSWSFYAKGTKKGIQAKIKAWEPLDGMEADTSKHVKDTICAILDGAKDTALFDIVASGHMQDSLSSAQVVSVSVLPIVGFEFDPDETPVDVDAPKATVKA